MPNQPRRSILDLLRPNRRKRKRAAELGLPQHPNTFSRIIPASDIDPSPIRNTRDALSQYSGWVFAAASFIAEETAALDWDVWRATSTDRADWTIDATSDINRVLRAPSAHQSWGQFIELTDLHFSTAGQAFWHIITSGERAVGMEVIYPHWVQEPVVSTAGRLEGWRVAKPGRPPTTLPADDVIRIYRPHPLSTFMAASIVEAAAVSHYMDLYVRAYGASVFRNDGGIPAGLLSSDQSLTPQQADDVRERWRQRYSRSRGEVAVLGAGTTYQQLGIPLEDLKFLEVGEFTRDQVLALFRVSPALLGLTGDSNRANLEASLWGFQRHTLRPRATRYQEAINERVIPRFEAPRQRARLYFEFRDVVSRDRDRVASEADQLQARGVITVNEHRVMMGLPETPDGDVYLVPSGVSIRATLQPDGADEPPSERAENLTSGAYMDAWDGIKRAASMPPLDSDVVAARMRAAALLRDFDQLKRDVARERWYRAWRSTVAGWMSDARKAGYPDDWAPPVEDVPGGVTLPARADGQSLVEWLEHLKGPGGKMLAEAVVKGDEHG